MAKILIVEDDTLYAVQLEAMLDKIGYTDIHIASSYEQAYAYLTTHNVDLVIIDIFLSTQKNGIELAFKIKHLLTPIIFITASIRDDFYQQIASLPLSVFIAKPFHIYTLDSAIKNQLKASTKHLYGEFDGEVYNLEEIIYLEAENTYTFIYLSNKKKIVLKKSLTQIFSKLPQHLFIKIHRKYVVNKKFIEKFDLEGSSVRLTGNIILQISRRIGQDIRKEFLND